MRGYSYEWLRVTVWFVLLATLCGNLVVIVVLVTGRSKMTVPKFLMCNLSFADLLMGLYLLLLASIDVHSLGEYFTHAVTWQNDGGCQVGSSTQPFGSGHCNLLGGGGRRERGGGASTRAKATFRWVIKTALLFKSL